MYKKLFFLILLSSTITVRTGENSSGLFIPTTFRVTTAFDNITVPKICQTLTWTAGISMFYKAFGAWAKSYAPYIEAAAIPAEATNSLICRGYRQASIRYFIAGCAFTAAGFLQKYGSFFLR